MNTKQCTKCKEVKSVDEFYKKSGAKNGLESACKICRDSQKSITQKKRITGEIKYIKKQTKACPKCGIEKGVSEFHKDKNRCDGYSIYCKLCIGIAIKKSKAKKKLQYIQPTEKPRYGLIDLNRVKMVDEFKRAKIIQEQLYDEQTSLLEITKKHRSVIVQRNSMELPKFKVVEKDLNFVK
jgi:hypothetical protein